MISKTLDPFQIPISQLHKLLLASIAPRPIAFVSTVDSQGNPNLSPFSFFNAFGVNPSTLIFSPSRRGRDNTTKHTYQNIKEVPEAVINVVNYDMVHQASLASTEYPRGVNEFVKAGFTAVPSEKIKPPRVKESPVQFECKVRQVIETGDGGGAANLVICEILMIHVNEEILDENGLPDPNKIQLVGRHAGDYYVKAFGKSLFNVEKPLTRIGIGVDRLPENVRLSSILTGNHLGQLGNLEKLPDEADLQRIKTDPLVTILFDELADDPETLGEEIHLLAKDWIDQGRVLDALCALMLTK
ncbi:MAG: flavin reductase family protein [Bacteroidales bacterium]|nr:flavin reductase family protein [Bacteroidales bacterium]